MPEGDSYDVPRQIVTFDLDSTLCNTEHRHGMVVRDGTMNWVHYSLACADDTPFEEACAFARECQKWFDLWIVSGRSIQSKEITEKWLHEQGIYPVGYKLDTSNWSSVHGTHGQYKVAMLKQIEAETQQRIAFHVDDWREVYDECDKAGYSCVLIEPAYMTGDTAMQQHVSDITPTAL